MIFRIPGCIPVKPAACGVLLDEMRFIQHFSIISSSSETVPLRHKADHPRVSVCQNCHQQDQAYK